MAPEARVDDIILHARIASSQLAALSQKSSAIRDAWQQLGLWATSSRQFQGRVTQLAMERSRTASQCHQQSCIWHNVLFEHRLIQIVLRCLNCILRENQSGKKFHSTFEAPMSYHANRGIIYYHLKPNRTSLNPGHIPGI